MGKDKALSQAERKHSTEMAGLSNDLEKMKLVEERKETYKKDEESKVAAVDKGEKDVIKLSVEKGKSKKGKFFERVNRLSF